MRILSPLILSLLLVPAVARAQPAALCPQFFPGG